MAFWSSETLEQKLPAGLIEPFDPSRIVHGAYELGVGPQAFITSSSGDSTVIGPGKKVVIPPGQFGLLQTNEIVAIPNNAIGFISIRAGVKFLGLINVSGFHVDPGFRGRLKFAVYNAGSKNIVLDQDQRVFMIWFSDLDRETTKGYGGQRPGQNEITAEDVMRLQGEVASPAELKKQIEGLRADYERRLIAVEKSEAILRWLVGALFLVILGLLLKPSLELLIK
jgi:dCTP deaminase